MNGNKLIVLSKLSHSILVLMFVLFAILVNPLWIDSALAFSQKLQLSNDNGYKIETIFSYEQPPRNKIIIEHGSGKTKTVNSMTISFVAPDGHRLANYNNISGGYSAGQYFRFNYDLASEQPLGEIDLGGESPGEIYLKGSEQQGFSLIKINDEGLEQVMEQFSGKFQRL